MEHAAIAQVHLCITTDETFQSATIDELTLYQVVEVAYLSGTLAMQVDGRAVGCIVDVIPLTILLADNTLLTTAIQLEGITLVQVDGGGAPYLRVLSVATSEHVTGHTSLVPALLVVDDT